MGNAALFDVDDDTNCQAHGDGLVVERRRFISPIRDRHPPAFGEGWPRWFLANRFHKPDVLDLA
jgi:hypothetical protein